MITFKNPTSVTLPDRAIGTFNPIKRPNLDWIVTYDNTAKTAVALIKGLNCKLSLWSGAEYDAAGQFTDNDVTERVIAALNLDASTIANK